MSALSTPGGGGTTAQSKPTSGKQKYQKLDINSLYCANRNESSEPSSVKSQLSRKHGMQSLGKVPSARRPPANLPSLKTETGQDSNANSISATAPAVSSTPSCTSQTTTTISASNVHAGASGGWMPLPPQSSPHFRTEFPSLEAAAQPSHRTDHPTSQPQLRPQTEGSWTSGGARQDAASSPAAAPASTPASQTQAPSFRTILPSFLMKGSNGSGLGGLGALGTLRETRSSGAPRGPPRPSAQPPPSRTVENVLTARPILRDEQINSLDDISRDAGWAQHDDIDYDQKLDFSDGESSAPSKPSNNKNNNSSSTSSNRASIETERVDTKLHEPGDEDQIWAERRQKQSNEVAQAVARARQRKEEEQRRQMRDSATSRELVSGDRGENRDRDPVAREKERSENKDRDRLDQRDRNDNREMSERGDMRDRDSREKERLDNRDRDRNENRDRFDNRDRDREIRDRDRDRVFDSRDRGRMDNRERLESDKSERVDNRNDNRDRERNERDRFERDRERNDRDRDRDRQDRERLDRDRERDRDYRERDRDYGRDRDRDQSNPAFSKNFQANIPPRFLKQQQNRQQEEQHKGWAFTGKTAPRRQEPPSFNTGQRHPPHNGRRSYSRDFSDREDDFRREKEGSGPQWRTEMQDRPPRDQDRSKDQEYKDRRSDSDKKLIEPFVDQNSRSAADKLSEVFERKSVTATESSESLPIQERRNTPPANVSQRESSEKDFGKASWAEIAQDESVNQSVFKSVEVTSKETDSVLKETFEKENDEKKPDSQQGFSNPIQLSASSSNVPTTLHQLSNKNSLSQPNSLGSIQTPSLISQPQSSSVETKTIPNSSSSTILANPVEISSNTSQTSKQCPSESTVEQVKYNSQKLEKEFSETESVISKSSTEPAIPPITKVNEAQSVESLQNIMDSQKHGEGRRIDRFSNDQTNKLSAKEPVERKSSGSGSEKRGRGGYGSGGVGGYAVYNNRGWGSRDPRGRRSHRNPRSNRASESDGSTDGAPNLERKERRRAPRSPRGPKKADKPDENKPIVVDQNIMPDMDNNTAFAPRGQPSRRGRGGFQGASRPPAPAKRIAGYGPPPNAKSPFSQANRVKENEEIKDTVQPDDKSKTSKRTGSSGVRGRDRRAKGTGAPHSGEDENWETTSEHSEGGGAGGRRRSAASRQKGQGGRNQNSGNRQTSGRNIQGKNVVGDNKSSEILEAMNDLRIGTGKKDEEVIDDGFQEVRNKKNSKDSRGQSMKEEQNKQPRSHSNQGGGRNQSSSRNSNDKQNSRGSAPVSGKPNPQFDRPRQPILAPRFVKQRQKQQMGMMSGITPDISAAPPPPAVNAWDKPISQTLRGNTSEEPIEIQENKSGPSSQRSTPAEIPVEIKPTTSTSCTLSADKTGVLDGTTPPVETIIFENTNYKTAPPAEALKQKYQPSATTAKSQTEELPAELEARPLSFNGDVRSRPRSIQELIGDNGRPVGDSDNSLGLQMSFDTSQKAEDSSDMKLDFAFDSDLGQLTEDKTAKSLGLPRSTHMSTSNTISPLAADLNLKIASVKKVWEMPAVTEGNEELQFAGFEETNTETGAPPNVCKVKPTQQLQSPPPQHYNHVSYQGGYGGLSVPSPPAVLFNSSQQLLGSSQQLQQQGGLYGAFLDQSRGQFGGFPGTPYGAGSGAPYNYQPPPDIFQSIPSQYRMAAAAAGGGQFGQSGQLGNNPSTVLISSTSNSLMSATVKPSSQQIGAIGSKGGGVGGVGGVNTYGQQYVGYSTPVGEAPYSLPGLLPRPAPPASSYYSPYQGPTAPAPTYPLQFTQPAQSGAFGSQFLSSQLQVAAAVQQMQQQYRAPLQQQFAPRPPPNPQQQLKSPLHEHANGFAPLYEAASPSPKPSKQKPPHSPPHKYHAPPPHHVSHQHHQHAQHPQHPPPAHTPHHHQQQQVRPPYDHMVSGGGAAMSRGGVAAVAPRYPAPIQRPHAPAPPVYRAPPVPRPHHRANINYYQHNQRNGSGNGERPVEGGEVPTPVDEPVEAPPAPDAQPAPAELKAE